MSRVRAAEDENRTLRSQLNSRLPEGGFPGGPPESIEGVGSTHGAQGISREGCADPIQLPVGSLPNSQPPLSPSQVKAFGDALLPMVRDIDPNHAGVLVDVILQG